MIRALLYSIGKTPSSLNGKHLYYPKYGTSHYEPQEYRHVLTPYKMKFQKERNIVLDQPGARGGSECNIKNPSVKPNES